MAKAATVVRGARHVTVKNRHLLRGGGSLLRDRKLLVAALTKNGESVLDCVSERARGRSCLIIIRTNTKNVSVTLAPDCGAVAGVLSVGLTKVFKLLGLYGSSTILHLDGQIRRTPVQQTPLLRRKQS